MSSLGQTKLNSMKTLTIFSAFIALSCMAFFSCQEQTDATSNADAANNTPSWDRDNSFIIDSAEARTRISEYQAFIEGIIDTLSHGDPAKEAYYRARLVSGARVYIHELQAMMDSVKVNFGDGRNTDSASLYVMLAQDPLNDSDSTHIIFNLNFSNNSNSSSIKSLFYDFVRPCPTSCPPWYKR
jgi:hypothetical protein